MKIHFFKKTYFDIFKYNIKNDVSNQSEWFGDAEPYFFMISDLWVRERHRQSMLEHLTISSIHGMSPNRVWLAKMIVFSTFLQSYFPAAAFTIRSGD